MERIRELARLHQAEAGGSQELPSQTAALSGEAARAEALFSMESRAADAVARIVWVREWGLWAALALAAVLATWRAMAGRGSFLQSRAWLVAGGASVLAVVIAYVWMRRAFGRAVAISGALLLAVANAAPGLTDDAQAGGALHAGPALVLVMLVPALLALWALLLYLPADGRTASGGRASGAGALVASLPLAVAAYLVPAAGAFACVELAALAMHPALAPGQRGAARSPARSRSPSPRGRGGWGVRFSAPPRPVGEGLGVRFLAVALPVLAAALGAAHGVAAAMSLPSVPRWLAGGLLGVVVAGWIVLGVRLAAPARALWRWYALASDPRERRRAVWAGLVAEPRWSQRALLWLTCGLGSLALLASPRAIAALALLPAACALPGMVAEEPRQRRAVWVSRLWVTVLGALIIALAVVVLRGGM